MGTTPRKSPSFGRTLRCGVTVCDRFIRRADVSYCELRSPYCFSSKKPPTDVGVLRVHVDCLSSVRRHERRALPSLSPVAACYLPRIAGFSRDTPFKQVGRRINWFGHCPSGLSSSIMCPHCHVQARMGQDCLALHRTVSCVSSFCVRAFAWTTTSPPGELLLAPHSQPSAFEAPMLPAPAPGEPLPAAEDLPALAARSAL